MCAVSPGWHQPDFIQLQWRKTPPTLRGAVKILQLLTPPTWHTLSLHGMFVRLEFREGLKRNQGAPLLPLPLGNLWKVLNIGQNN